MPDTDPSQAQIDTKSILFSDVHRFDGVEFAESVDQNGSLILWALSPDPAAHGTYDYPDHEDPTYPLRHTLAGRRLAAFSPASPGRCNALTASGGHCRMPAGRCRFHVTEGLLF